MHDTGWGCGDLDLHPAHRVDHVPAVGAKTASVPVRPVEHRENQQECDVEVGGVVPGEVGWRHLKRALRRDQAGSGEDLPGDEAGRRHGRPEDEEHAGREPGSVVTAVDEQEREADQVGEQERDDSAK
jgi:hypothetical protein